MNGVLVQQLRKAMQMDAVVSGLALIGMALIPMIEMVLRPFHGQGIDNAPVVVQHLGLLVAMMGAVAAQRHGQLSSLGLATHSRPSVQMGFRIFSQIGGAVLSGMLCAASWTLVASEMASAPALAYGLPLWWVQAFLPLGFGILALKMGWQGMPTSPTSYWRGLAAIAWPLLGGFIAWTVDLQAFSLVAGGLLLLALLLTGAPIFAVLGGLGILLLGHEGLPLASLALSHYQITVNPSLPALPLFTLAGLVLAKTQASQRLSRVFVSLLGDGPVGTVLAVALLCSCFTALTGGSGVTILALGGLLLPLLKSAGYP